MFLKVMHDGADEFLATAQSEATYSIYDDIVSCHFRRGPDGEWAHIWCREPVKTADVPGYSEVEKHIKLDGDAFVLNNQGRTIDKFILRPFGTAGNAQCKASEPSDEDRALELLKNLPYSVAAAIRTTARHAGSVSADYLIKLLDKARVAVDA